MSSRKEQKERLRQERLERERAAAAASARRRRLGYGVAGLMVIAVVIALGAVALGGGGSSKPNNQANASGDWPDGSIPAQKTKNLETAVEAAGCVLENPKSRGAGHTGSETERVTYKSEPPTSGKHWAVPTSDNAYVASPKPYEGLVHALEHGRVIYWFKPGAPANVRGALKKLYDEEEALVVLTPNARSMPYQVAASAWTRFVGCPTYNDKVPDAFRAFRDAYRLKGPEYVPNKE